MYQTLIFYHSFFRWLVLLSLLYAIYRAVRGLRSKSVFSKTDNLVRHWTATIAHIQLVIGILIYSQSPIIRFFWSNLKEGFRNFDALFFSLIHILFMLSAIVCVTIGSALAKRRVGDSEKFKTQLIWFSLSLILIFIAIPWPFSPFTSRPFFR